MNLEFGFALRTDPVRRMSKHLESIVRMAVRTLEIEHVLFRDRMPTLNSKNIIIGAGRGLHRLVSGEEGN